MLSEMSQRKTDIVSSKTTIATKKPKLIDTENRLVIARVVGYGCGLDKMGEGGQKVQTSSYKIKFGDIMYSMLLLLLLSCFSRVQLFVTPEMAAH